MKSNGEENRTGQVPDEGEPAPNESAPHRQLTGPELAQRQLAPVRHGLYITTPTATRLRQRRLRARVRRLRIDYPQLAEAPRHLVMRYVEVDSLAANVWLELEDQGPVNKDGEPRRLLSEYRLLLVELRSLADALGILTPVERDLMTSLLSKERR